MSTEMTVIDYSKLPANVASLMQQMMADAVGGISGGAINRISLKGSRFRLMKGGNEIAVRNEPYLDAVVVGVNPGVSKTFYAQDYKPGQEPAAPDCSSSDGIKPDSNSKLKQSDTCAACKQNVWGSKINKVTGKEIKACADSKRIAVMLEGNFDGEAYQISIPGASMADWKKWVDYVSTNRSNLLALTTRVRFDTDSEFPKLQFGKGRPLEMPEIVRMAKVAVSDEVKHALNLTPAEIDGVLLETPAPAPAAKPEKAKAKAAPAPAPEPEPVVEAAPVETDVVEDNLTKAFADLAATDWDD